MSDRSDPPEYDWLYGKRKAARSGPDATSDATSDDAAADPAGDPEPTRVMPRTSKREMYAQPPAPGTPAVQPSAPVRKRQFPWGRVVLLVLVAWIAYLVAVPFIAWNRIDQVDAAPSGARPADQPGTTYLLVGSDSRKGLTKKENRRLGTGGVGDVGQRTDTIMLLHTGSGPSLLLSIPRDSIVPIPGHGTTKINAAFAYGGPRLLVKTIEQNTGVHVDHYVEIGFGGFVNSVDAVGGVTICPTRKMVDRRANLNIKKGCQHVNGITALGYARSRHTSGIGDIDRVRRQREVVSAVGHKVVSPWTVVNPVRYWRLNNAIPDFFTFGDGMGPIRGGLWATAMTRVNGDEGLTCVVPLQDLAVHWDPERSKEMFQKIIDDDTGSIGKDLCSDTGGIA